MITVHKYPLTWNDGNMTRFLAPPGMPVKIAFQRSTPTVWVEIDKSKPPVEWRFRAVMTGEEIAGSSLYPWSHVDTLFYDNGLVVHVYFDIESGIIKPALVQIGN